MLNNKQLEYLITLEEFRLIDYLKKRSHEELSAITNDIKTSTLPANGLSGEQKEKYLTTLSYVEAQLNAVAQKENINNDFELIDTTQFNPMSSPELTNILGLTIKRDEVNKLITFMTCLSAFTEDAQLNMSFNAPSSSGKSYIPIEIATLFPQEDVIEVGYCSPTAFFHSYGAFDKEKQGYIVDLSRKILIFLDQPHQQLLAHLRPVLSHDKKEIVIKVTDKTQKFGLKTKNIYVIGFPSVVFCTAGLKIDEQEATRLLLLSPEISQEKIRDAVMEKIKRESDKRQYHETLNENPERTLLKLRIKAIKQESINDVVIRNQELIKKMFFERIIKLKPKHQRDMGRIISLSKLFALLNLWYRERDNDSIVASDEDINEAFAVWDTISQSQELNLPPYVYDLYQDIIIQAFKEKNEEFGITGIEVEGLTKGEIQQKNYDIHGRFLPDWQLRQQILPMLETAGLITIDSDPKDKRKILIYPTIKLTISKAQNNSESDGGL